MLLRNGARLHQVVDGPLEINAGREPGVYRIEAYTTGAPGGPTVPWIVSNPIYAGVELKPPQAAGFAEPVSRIPARTSEASAETGPNDTSTVVTSLSSDLRARTFAGDPSIDWSFALSPGIADGQFAAVRVPVSGGLEAFDRVRFRVTASAPMRLWLQLRAPVGLTERWGSTFFVDTESRIVDLPLSAIRAIGPTASLHAPLERVDSLLFVVDTLNTLPGTQGRVTISEVALVK